MNLVKLTVAKSTETEYGNYLNKLVAGGLQTPFGTTTNGATYYLYTNTQCEPGLSDQLDMDLFNIVDKPFEIEQKDGSKEIVQLKYLKVRR